MNIKILYLTLPLLTILHAVVFGMFFPYQGSPIVSFTLFLFSGIIVHKYYYKFKKE
ncbi:MAG: hypothetical protein ACI81T_000577 [Bacteroidia bacterium]|jgi:hypothetical protein